ncbi:hypothetical protein ATCC90586_006371 [Pythium insidiosum]|nr:hypothetical protein ATCC90586_006371 [Pythium insidiosum]
MPSRPTARRPTSRFPGTATGSRRRASHVVPISPASSPSKERRPSLALRRVSGSSSTPPSTSRASRLRALLQALGTRLLNAWESMQVSHRGAYSIERLYALHEYSRHASLPRVVAVCVLVPLPPLLLILAIESVPLADPADGWRANGVIFARAFICGIGVAFCVAMQARNIVPDLRLTRRECVAISLATALFYALTFLLLAAVWVFPVPYLAVLGFAPFIVFFVASTLATVGVKRFATLPHLRQRFREFTLLISAQGSLVVMYPVIHAIFSRLPTTQQQLAFLLVLPLIKQFMKNVHVRLMHRYLDDYVPETTVFAVDAFHGLYLSACLQSTSSRSAKFLIIGLDIANQLLSLSWIYRRTKISKQLFSDRAPIHRTELIAIVMELVRFPNRLDAVGLKGVRLRSCLRHRLSRRGSLALHRLAVVHPNERPTDLDDDGSFGDDPAKRLELQRQRSLPHALLKASPSSILPFPLAVAEGSIDNLAALTDQVKMNRLAKLVSPTPAALGVSASSTVSATSGSSAAGRAELGAATTLQRRRRIRIGDVLTRDQKAQLLEQTVSMLFQCEYLSLAEYVECIVPVLYAIYLPVVYALPNGRYHTDMNRLAAADVANAVENILLYALLELGSLIAFHVLLSRHLSVSPLHLIAFVLENQMEMVEAKLLTWVLIVLQLQVVHFGASI